VNEKRHAPATQRNREPIAEVLARELPPQGCVLEIASGTGEHAVFFAARFSALEWQPSDPDEQALASIAAYRRDYEGENLSPPLLLDAAAPADWPIKEAAAILCINMVHISEWAATLGLFQGCAQVLTNEAPIILYGPYLEDGVETAVSNLEFDQSLKARNPAWGLRRLDEVDRIAAERGFARTSRYEMPANNLALVYRKRSA
jgi:hypothetical protein